MKKRLVTFMAGLLALTGLSGCTKGIEKEYTMTVQNEPVIARLASNENEEVLVVHCKRGMSLFNYYIALPELEEGFIMPEKLTAKATDTKTKYYIINEKGKSEDVSDHGYIFVHWGEKQA